MQDNAEPRESIQQRGKDAGGQEIKESFGAFKEHVQQGRQLKQARREQAALAEELEDLQAQLDDNLDILEHHAQITSAKAAEAQGARKLLEAAQAELDRSKEREEFLNAQLSADSAAHARELTPFSDALYAANRALADAKAAQKDCIAKRNEARKAMRAEDAGPVQEEALQHTLRDLSAAEDALKEAKSVQKGAQRAYDAKADAFKKAEAKLKAGIKEARERQTSSADEIRSQTAAIEQAEARIAHCDHVAQNPHETEELRSSIDALRQRQAEVEDEITQLERAQDQTKEPSSLARNIVFTLIGAVIFVIVGSVLIQLFT